MKKAFIYPVCVLLFSGCGSMDSISRSIIATHTGAAIGSIAGSIIGENIGGYRGAHFGSFVGSAAGALIGAGVVARQQAEKEHPVEMVATPSPYLVIRDIRLQDENWNRVVDADESCRLIFEIFNEGEKTAYDVKPLLRGVKGTRHLLYSMPIVIDQIKPGEGLLYKVNLSASDDVKSGEAVFEICLEERNGFGTPKEEFTIRTEGKY